MTDLQQWAQDELDALDYQSQDINLSSAMASLFAVVDGGVSWLLLSGLISGSSALEKMSDGYKYYVRELNKIRNGERFTKVTWAEAKQLLP